MAEENREINSNVRDIYLRAITFEPSKVPSFKRKFTENGEDLFELIINQNNQVLQASSDIYNAFNDAKEESQNQVEKLNAVLDQLAELKPGSGETRGNPVSYGSGDHLGIAFGEFDKKIDELEKQIKNCDEKIDVEKKSLSINSDKIKDTKEYLQKFVLEKRLYLDKVDELAMRGKSKS